MPGEGVALRLMVWRSGERDERVLRHFQRSPDAVYARGARDQFNLRDCQAASILWDKANATGQ
jgi:hypothetical protein